ncbi:MAG: GNAT family N-acetyltransferase [Asticcacaulis sp.]
MITCDLIDAGALDDRHMGRWHEMMAATPLFRSPVLSPEFVKAVAEVRTDVRIAVISRGSEVIAYLPHHRRPNHFARPAGAPFSDYSALITFPDPGVAIGEVLETAGIQRYHASGLVDPYGVFGDVQGEGDEAFGMDLTADETVNNVNKKQTKNINRLRRHLIEAHGDLDFIIGDRDRDHFERMLRLKREQVRQNGLHDFLGAPWVKRFLDNLFAAPSGGLHGQLVTFTAGGKPTLFHFGVRLGDRAHPWISTYDPAYYSFSPGQIFLTDIQAPLKASGLVYYDLSTGQQHYKSSFCNTSFPVRHARFYSDAPAARMNEKLAGLAGQAQKALGPTADMAFTRLGRRVDQIATLELDFLGRAKGVAYALSNAGKRWKATEHA